MSYEWKTQNGVTVLLEGTLIRAVIRPEIPDWPKDRWFAEIRPRESWAPAELVGCPSRDVAMRFAERQVRHIDLAATDRPTSEPTEGQE